MPARRVSLLVRAGAALLLALVIAACTPGGQFDPTEVFDSLDTKKRVQGQREPLFPNGVPGAETGVPPDLVKGYQPPPEQAADNGDAAKPAAATSATAAAEKPKSKPKPKPKPKVARAPATATQTNAAHDPVWDQKPVSPAQQGGQSPWPAQTSGQPPQTNWPAPPSTQPGATNWPSPPPTKTQ